MMIAPYTALYTTFQVVVAPPLYRHRPFWYQKNLTQVADRFSAVMCANQPPNLLLLPSFSCQDYLLPDGVFLNPVSGLHYVLYLFDQTEQALRTAASGSDQQLVSVEESVRQCKDRVSYLENRHGGLQRQVDFKSAQDAEFSDWMINRSEEDWMVITGLPRLSGTVDWQNNARRQVADAIKLILHTNRVNLDFEVVYVSNPFRFQPNRPPTLNVRMDSFRSCQRIRDLFSGFFRKNRPVACPPPLKGVSLRNKVTPDTKIRISILHQLGSIYMESNNGGSYKVLGFASRPQLITVPPRNSTDRQRTYTFMQAVTLLPATFNDDHLTRIYQVVSSQQPGKLQSLFVVLSDDDRERCLELVKAKRASQQPNSQAPASSSSIISGAFAGSGAGMEPQTQPLTLEALQEPPPLPPSPSHHRGSDQATKVKVKAAERDREQSKEREHVKERSREREHIKERSRDRDESRGRDRSGRGERRRRQSSSSSSDGHRRKKAKKSKKRSKRRQTTSESSASTASSSSRGGHSRREAQAEDKSRTRER